MTKKVRFPLNMGNDVKAHSIEELKANYNAEKVTEYFISGKLLTWLEDRYYDEEAEKVRELSEQSYSDPAVKLAEIFGVEIEESVDVEMLEIRRKKLEKLREITSEDEILDNVDHVAFSQEELGDLLDDEAEVIYLCGENFRIPLSVKNVRYVGVNNPVVTISGKGEIDIEANGIIIERCELPQGIKENIILSQKKSECKIKFYVPKQTPAVKYNNTVLAAEYDNDVLYIYFKMRSFRVFVDGYHVYQVCASRHNTGELGVLISKTEVYSKGNSAFEMYKNQMLEALDNLPKQFKKKDGIVDITDSETVSAVEEAVRLFVEYNKLNPIIDIVDYNPDEEPYD